MIMKTTPTVFGKDIETEIGAPQEYLKNKEDDTFPESYDLRLPGAKRGAEFTWRSPTR